MITCEQLVGFLNAYLDRELPLTTRASFELHLLFCSSCRNYLRTYRQTVDLVQAALRDPDAAPPADVPEALVAAILASRAAGD